VRLLSLCLALLAAPAELPSGSLYRLTASWRDSNGNSVTLRSLEGAPVVLAMIYTSCQGACPMLVADLQRLEAKLPEPVRRKVRFVLVSFDPKRDSPQALSRFAKAHGLDPARWTLLTGDEDSVRELAAALGMRYRPLGAADFAHSNLITALDAHGAVTAHVEGLGADPAPIISVLAHD
jgi:protein SCO1/2